MCAETAYLIELTAAFLRDEPVTLRPDIDYHKLCGIAKAHNLIAVVYAVCNKAPNTEVIPEDCRLALSEHFFRVWSGCTASSATPASPMYFLRARS